MAAAGIVGSWRVSVQIPGVEQAIVNLATLSSDQTVVVAFATPSPAAAGQNHRMEFFPRPSEAGRRKAMAAW